MIKDNIILKISLCKARKFCEEKNIKFIVNKKLSSIGTFATMVYMYSIVNFGLRCILKK